ncbi:MAG: V-type ATP synthase subunit I [Lentisphaeria bacterium]
MKKVNVICLAADRADTVERLGDLGIVHVEEVKPPRSRELDELVTYRDRLQRALMLLQARETPAPEVEKEWGHDYQKLVDDILETSQEINQTRDRLNYWRRSYSQVEPWGGFSRDLLAELEQKGIKVYLCAAPEKQIPELPEGAVLVAIKQQKNYLYFAVVTTPDVTLDVELPEIQLPEETNLEAIESHIETCQKRSQYLNNTLDELAAYRPHLQEHLEEIEEQLEFLRARETMGEAQSLCYLEGYVPADSVETLRQAAETNGWGLYISDPDEDDPSVPTKISLPRWVEPIRVVFKAMGIMPGYREVDISAFFMVFLTVFFAMLVGDTGYGVIFLAAAMLARRKFKEAPAQPFWLLGIFGATTMVWGALNGTYFGIQSGLGPLANLELEFFTGEESDKNIQRLCFFLGALHLAIAHCWNAVIYGKSLKAVRELGWAIMVWGNFYLARLLVCGDPVESAVVAAYVPGLLIVVLITVIRDFGFVNLLLMAFSFINAFVDVVSYIRLYAVGMATVAVAQSFNNMAMDLAFPVWLQPLAMALILFLGHSLNILLASMSVLVHGVRLNVLEFSQHLGMEWTGRQYEPLTRRKLRDDSALAESK